MQKHINTVHNEHLKIAQLAAPIVKRAKANDAAGLHKEIRKISEKLIPLMMSHFMLEENILYPAIVLNNDTTDTIDEMLLIQKEHGILEQQLKQLIFLVKMTTEQELSKESKLSILLISLTLELYNTITEHQRHEDILFNNFGIS